MSSATQFINCRQCIHGTLISASLTVDSGGFIITNVPLPLKNTTIIDLHDAIISPGFVELQTNGALGFHFSQYTDPESYEEGVQKIASHLPITGVTAFYPTIPTVSTTVFQGALPLLKPNSLSTTASILGAHVEGPFLARSKKGAHDASNLLVPSSTSLTSTYGEANLLGSIRLLTLAPELVGALEHIRILTREYHIRVSMGHSAATVAEGESGLDAGATLLTHTFNAMAPLHHREPGLAGLISLPNPPYFTIIADGIHLHPRVVALAFHASPSHCILITDSIELSGLPDGIYPGHAQIPGRQVKEGNKVTIEGSETLVGTCIGLDECVRNLMAWTGVRLEEAVMCVTENVAEVMGLKDRGVLEVGRRADFVVLSEEGVVRETWIVGKRVHQKAS